MKKTIIKIMVLLICSLTLVSCYNTRILVGEVGKHQPVTQVKKVWTHGFLFGLIPGGNAKANPKDYIGDAENYVVKTNHNFWNMLVSGVTFGIYTPTNTVYYLPVK